MTTVTPQVKKTRKLHALICQHRVDGGGYCAVKAVAVSGRCIFYCAEHRTEGCTDLVKPERESLAKLGQGALWA